MASLATTQFSPCSAKAATDNMQMNGHGCFNKTLITKINIGLDLACGPQFADLWSKVTNSWWGVASSFFFFNIYLFIWLCQVLVVAHRIFSCVIWTLSCVMWNLVPWPGTEPGPPALEMQSLSHWTTREVPRGSFSFKKYYRGFPGGAVVENPPANAGDTGLSPGLGGSHMLRSN